MTPVTFALPALCLGVLASGAVAQDWEPAGMPLHANYVRDLYVDTVNDALYATGAIESVPWGTLDVYICRYQNHQWTALGVFNQAVYNVVNYHDTLVASGLFTSVNGQACSGIAFYDGDAWHPFGVFNYTARNIRVLDGELYAFGGFDEIDGSPAYGVAKRVGNSWQPPAPAPTDFSGIVIDVALYQDELYVCGSFDFNGGLNDIMRFDGENWTDLDGSLLGGLTNASRMEVFGDDLIVGGEIYAQAGNAGNGIMAWDGAHWHPLDYGLSDENNTYSGVCTVTDMCVHGNVLYVGGGFFHAGGIAAKALASWDGQHWCNVGGPDLISTRAVAFFHDSLYVGTAYPIGGDDMNCLARWIGGAYADTCSLPTGMIDSPMVNDRPEAFLLRPDTWTILGLPDGPYHLDLFDTAGRKVLSAALKSTGGRSTEVNTSTCSPAVYNGLLTGPRSVGVRLAVLR